LTILKPTIHRIMKIWWFLLWRTVLFGAIAGFVMGFILGILLLFTQVEEQTKILISQSAGLLVTIPVGIWVLSLLFDKAFADFRIVLVSSKDDGPSDT